MSKKSERLLEKVLRDVKDLTAEQLDEVVDLVERAASDLEDLSYTIHDLIADKSEDK